MSSIGVSIREIYFLFIVQKFFLLLVRGYVSIVRGYDIILRGVQPVR